MKRLVISASVALLVLSLTMATTARAAIIKTNGNVVFDSNGLESDAIGTAPSAATAGSWYVTSPTETNDVKVYAGGSGGVPAAAYDNKLLKVYKPLGGGINSRAEAVMSSAAAAGDVVEAEYSIYIDSAGNTQTGGDGLHAMGMFVTSSADSYSFPNRYTMSGFAFQGGDLAGIVDSTGIGATDLYVAQYNGAWGNVTRADNNANMYISPDAWHSVKMNLTVGLGYTMSIDGVTSNFIAIESGIAGNPVGFTFCNNVNDKDALFYVDGVGVVPEPASIVMVLGALIGLVAYAWRKRG